MTDKEYQAKLHNQRRNDSKRKKKKKEEDAVYRYYSRSKHRIGNDSRHEERAYNYMSKMWASPDATKLMREAIDDYHDELFEANLIVNDSNECSTKMPEVEEIVDIFDSLKKEFSFVYMRLREAAVKYGADAFLLEEFDYTLTSFMEEATDEHLDGMSHFLHHLETELYDLVKELFNRRLQEFELPWLKVPTGLFRYDEHVLRKYY